jgi:IMP cyclohydrolase
MEVFRNFRLHLVENPYPGRGFVVGLDETGEYVVQVYWIMGRSANSRNRVFKANHKTGRLYTEAADPSKVKDPSLIIYNAMLESVPSHSYVVSNGDQTDAIMKQIHHSAPFPVKAALDRYQYEPDDPNFTQRIAAVSTLDEGGYASVKMSILRKSQFDNGCDRLMYEFSEVPSGLGFCVTTYAGDGDPLPPFRGDPLLMALLGGPVEILESYWDALNEENRVSLAVKWIEKRGGWSEIYIKNKYEQV